MNSSLKIIECPRDAMQGYQTIFSTQEKIEYINQLLKVGFDVLDCVSFVSPKAIPQMADSVEVLKEIDTNSSTKLLGIVANARGAETGILQDKISILGYPFSISETFQRRNTNRSIEESIQILEKIQQLCREGNKSLVVYLSMGFGNPYNEDWSVELVKKYVQKLAEMGIETISLSDTIGCAKEEDLRSIFSHIIPTYPDIEFGAHLHCKPYEWIDKLKAAHDGGCRRFDGAIRGFGGCPMADDDLTGNMQTESIISLFKKDLPSYFSFNEFDQSLRAADRLFNH